MSSEEKAKAFDSSVIINRTKLQPCDQVISLYTLYPNPPIKNRSIFHEDAKGCERFLYKFCKTNLFE